MTEQKWFLRLVGAFVFTAACSNNEAAKNDDMVVQGTVSQALRTGNVQAVALGADGRSFWSALDTRGDFRLTIPAGQSYRIVLADRGAGDQRKAVSVAFLALTTGAGKTKWVLGKSGSTLRLGTLLPAGSIATAQAAGLKTQSGSTDTMTGASDAPADGATDSGSGRGGSGSGRGGSADDGSGRGGSGRGGSGRGGADADADDDHDDFDDDQSHADDPPCHQGGHDGAVCPASSPAAEMESSRDGADDVSECGDAAHADDDDHCTGDVGGGSDGVPSANGSSGSSGAVSSSGSVPPPGGGAAAGGAAAGGAGASSPPSASPGVN